MQLTCRHRNNNNSLHDAILEFERYISPTPAECRMRMALITNIISLAQGLWPEVLVVPFGSFISGLFLPNRY